jgi:hypothetical protein
VNFPTRVEDERELIRYTDIMPETLSRKEHLEERTTPKQKRNPSKLSGRALTTKLFGRRVHPLMCLCPPLPILSAVEAPSSSVSSVDFEPWPVKAEVC